MAISKMTLNKISENKSHRVVTEIQGLTRLPQKILATRIMNMVTGIDLILEELIRIEFGATA